MLLLAQVSVDAFKNFHKHTLPQDGQKYGAGDSMGTVQNTAPLRHCQCQLKKQSCTSNDLSLGLRLQEKLQLRQPPGFGNPKASLRTSRGWGLGQEADTPPEYPQTGAWGATGCKPFTFMVCGL